jgi:thioredoxin-related protein
MRRAFLRILCVAMLAPAAIALAQEAPNLPFAIDLRSDAAEAARRGVPVLLMVSLPGCPYCNAVRRSYLLPMERNPVKRAIVRQIDLNDTRMVRDFDGALRSQDAIARARGVRAAPVVFILGPEGRALASPLEGMLLPDFYGAYLDDAIARGAAALGATSVR